MAETDKKHSFDNPNLKEAREHFHNARKGMYKTWEKMLPEGLLEEHRAAHKEMLMGLRNMLDYAIERSEKHAAD